MTAVICPTCRATHETGLPQISSQWNVVECPECRHAFVRDWDKEPPKNAHFEADDYLRWRMEFAKSLRKFARKRADSILRRIGAKSGRVLELGCGTGEMLQEMAGRGWEAYGADLSSQAVQAARRSYPGIRISVGTEEQVLNGPGPVAFDLILAFHVLEHISDVDSTVERWRQLCAPGGWLVVFVPNGNSWSRAVLGDNWPDYMPEHLHFFCRKSLSRLLERHSFSVLHASTGGASWQWLGGLRRMLNGRSAAGLRQGTCSPRAMPGRLHMRALQLGDAVFLPLLLFERAFGRGSELCIMASRNKECPP